MVRAATTRETARGLGIAPTTLQKYAQARRVPFDTTPGGHRRYDLQEVARTLGMRHHTLDVARQVVGDWVDRLPAQLRPAWVGIFGSVARGEATPTSDIDVFLTRRAGLSFWDRDWGLAKADLIVRLGDVADERDVDLLDLGSNDLDRFFQDSPHLAESLDRDLVQVFP
ncbi:MAG: nucleotidyltransferase domain-containing protein [Acidimicrobiales bacterium]